jgi:radical SAM family protein/B12 binding protein
MAHLLCINPWIVDLAAYNLWIEPLGLLYVAAALRRAGHRVSLIDCLDRHHPAAPAPRSRRDAYGCGRFAKVELPKPPVLAHVPRRWGRYGLPLAVFDAELDAQPRPDAVLVTSMMTYHYPGPFEAIRRVRARWPGVLVALGGVYATLCPDHARAHSGADAVLTGPGEQDALDWVSQVTGDPLPLPDGDAMPLMPAHDLRRPQGYVALLTARGCPFHCPYCAVHLLDAPGERGGWRRRDPAHVVDEIAWCVRDLGARDVAFYDDALLVDAAQHIHPILDGVIDRGLRVRFHTPNGLHARFIDRPLACKMRRAGFVTLRLGLESADPAQQARDGGKVDDAVFGRAVEALFHAGYSAREVAAYVLAGRPGQAVEDVRATVSFAHRLGVPVSIAQFSPIPGTGEWGAAVDAGRAAHLHRTQVQVSSSAGQIVPGADPLLHNNSIYPCGGAQAWEAFKQEVREGNRGLRS